MHNQKKSGRAAAIQADEPRYAPNLEGTVTIYHADGVWNLIGRFNGQIYGSRSTRSLGKATHYAREWIELYRTGGMY